MACHEADDTQFLILGAPPKLFELLWMDQILHPLRDPGRMIPLQCQQTMVYHWSEERCFLCTAQTLLEVK